MALRRPAEAPFLAPAVRPGRRTVADRESILGPLLLAPALLYVILLVGVPFFMAILLSFSSAVAGGLEFSWVGFRNFQVLLSDGQFHRALQNTLRFMLVSQLLVMVLATAAAHVLDAAFVGKRLVRSLLLLPWAAPVALSSMAWVWIFDSTFSVINWTAKKLGLLQGWWYWFGDPGLATVAILTVHVWRTFPFATVVILAGMSAIPQEIKEAALMDGAGFWRRLFHVNLPMLLPVVAVAVLFGLVFTATDFSVVWLLTRGGPYNSTHVLSTLAFQRGVLGASLGQGAAVAIFLLPILLVVAVLLLRVARRAEVGA